MPSITGKVTGHIIENGWHKFKIGDFTLDTKIGKVVDGLDAGMVVEAEYTETTNTGDNGRIFTNRRLVSWKLADAPVEADADKEPLPVDKPNWDARDRAIAMESAYSSAAQYMQALAAVGQADSVTGANFIRLAHVIYNDVQSAKANKDFREPVA